MQRVLPTVQVAVPLSVLCPAGCGLLHRLLLPQPSLFGSKALKKIHYHDALFNIKIWICKYLCQLQDQNLPAAGPKLRLGLCEEPLLQGATVPG